MWGVSARILCALFCVLSTTLLSCGDDPDSLTGGARLRRGSSRTGSSSSGGESSGSSNGGGSNGGGSSSGAVTGTGSTFHELCWSTINEYRKREGLPPYQRWTDGEACADGQASDDAATRRPHGSFSRCKEFAQNECPGTPGEPEEAIVDCLAAMWREGPGGGHHDAMASTKYTMVACGVFDTGRGIWSVQNFR